MKLMCFHMVKTEVTFSPEGDLCLSSPPGTTTTACLQLQFGNPACTNFYSSNFISLLMRRFQQTSTDHCLLVLICSVRYKQHLIHTSVTPN